MVSPADASPALVTLAHPVSGHPHVDLPLALTAGVGGFVVFVATLALPAREQPPAAAARPVASWEGRLSGAQAAARVAAVALLGVAVVAGRIGADDELENLAPALVVGAGWPLLVLASVAVGPVWRWVDPWDALARVLARDPRADATDRDEAGGQVWAAAAVAVPVAWFLSAYPDPLDPRAVGTALALYTTLALAGCVAVGRVRWLASAEPVGAVLAWMARLPRRRLADWHAPRGADALLGVLSGGVLFGAVQRSGLWTGVGLTPGALAFATVGLVGFCALFAGFFWLMGRVAAPYGGRDGVARAVVPAAAGIVLAVALERDRLFTSVQLLPGLLGDPLGRGWDLLGPALQGLDPAPLGATGLLALQLGVLLVGHLLGAVVVAARLRDTARLPAATVLLHLMAGSVVAVAVH
jgi:hypothetical protein